MTTSSPWKLSSKRPKYPTLNSTIEVDVAVVGGGIAGITTAYLLAKAGKKVAVLEQGKIADGVTAWTTAFVTAVTDTYLTDLQSMFGAKSASLVLKSGQEAIDELEKIITKEKIECEFSRCTARIYAMDKAGYEKIHHWQKIAKSHGFPAQVDKTSIGFANKGHLRIENQAKFHPVKYVKGLAKRSAMLGVKIFENSKVISVSDESPCVVKTSGGQVRAKQVVLATHSPFGDPDYVSVRIDAYQTYVIEAKIPCGILPEGLYWDTHVPYDYFRVDRFPDHDRIILGGQDHRTGQSDTTTEARFAHLEKFLKRLLPRKKITIVRRWSGEVLETIDGLPYIGKAGKNHYMSTGFSGNGMSFGILSAMINRDLILGKSNAVTKLYRPRRLKGFWNLIGRVCNFTIGLVKGRVSSSSKTLNDIPLDEGAIVTLKGKKTAVYRTPKGKILKLSPVCTHMGCMVQWNSAGKSWDCPCHGSRFKKEGGVMNGPAVKPLKKMK